MNVEYKEHNIFYFKRLHGIGTVKLIFSIDQFISFELYESVVRLIKKSKLECEEIFVIYCYDCRHYYILRNSTIKSIFKNNLIVI